MPPQSNASPKINWTSLLGLFCRAKDCCQQLTHSKIHSFGRWHRGSCRHPTTWRSGSSSTRGTLRAPAPRACSAGAFAQTPKKCTPTASRPSASNKSQLTAVRATTCRFRRSNCSESLWTQNCGTFDSELFINLLTLINDDNYLYAKLHSEEQSRLHWQQQS